MLITLAVTSTSLWVEQVAAREPGVGNNYPVGLLLGYPVGANPPPGLHLSTYFHYYFGDAVGANGSQIGNSISTTAFAPRIAWVPTWTMLGASYMAFVVKPILSIDLNNSSNAAIAKTGHSTTVGFANTAWSPATLSWNLGNGWFASAGFVFYGPDGTYTAPVNTPAMYTVNAGNNFWTLEPDLAISYLGGGYDLTAHVAYNVNTENPTTKYRSGDQFFLDLTATKTFGHLEFGVVSYYSKQVTADVDSGHYFAPAFIDLTTTPTVFALGALIGYRLGPVLLKAHYTREVYARDTTMGQRFWLSVSVNINDNPTSSQTPTSDAAASSIRRAR